MGADYYTRVTFLREGADHDKHVKALRALEAAGEDVLPPKLAKYFRCESVSEALSDIDAALTEWTASWGCEGDAEIGEESAPLPKCVTVFERDEDDAEDDYAVGIEIDVEKIPKGVKKIRILADVSV